MERSGGERAKQVLPDHTKKGRRLLPPLAAVADLTIGDWVRDDLPDLLWPIMVLSELGDDGILRFRRWQTLVIADLESRIDGPTLAESLDGRLTGLDRLTGGGNSITNVVRDRALECGLLSPDVESILASYPHRPAEWLTGELRAPSQVDIDRLVQAVLGVLGDEHRQALIKCLGIWAGVETASLSVGPEAAELLQDYPGDAAKNSQRDGAVRAMWSSLRELRGRSDGDYWKPATDWAKVFWGTNSMTTGCVRKGDIKEHDSEVHARPSAPQAGGGRPNLEPGEFQQRAIDLTSSYLEAVSATPSRLYEPEREELNTGLVVRAARAVVVALGNESVWSSEHGAHIGRMLVEVQILLNWMALQDQETIYRRYKDYGAGKAKLHNVLNEDLPNGWLVPGAQEAVAAIRSASHNDDDLSHPGVSGEQIPWKDLSHGTSQQIPARAS